MSKMNDLMEFDHVIQVHEDGTVTDGPANVWAPDLFNGEIEQGSGWTLLDGYSGQSGYSGPVMHDSEYIGAAFERDILATPGLYVAIVGYWVADDDDDDREDSESVLEGWAVAYRSVEP